MALAEMGHSVTCVCLSYQQRREGTTSVTTPSGHVVRWLSMNLGSSKVLGFWRYSRLARKTIAAERPDVIWSASDTMYTVLGRHLAAKSACRFVADLYDNFEYFGSYRLPVLKTRYRRAVRKADGVSAVSGALQRYLADSYGRTKITRVITNAVDAKLFKPMDKKACRQQLGLPMDALLVGAAGDISDYRGADTLYRVFAERADELPDVTLAVAGYRTPDTQVPALANVIDLGTLPPSDVPVFLNCLDMVVIYNRSSTFGDFCFPQKFYEALACGVAPVIANVGELATLLEDVPEFLYEDGDVSGLAKRIQQRLEDGKTLDLPVPSWADQAVKLQQLLREVLGDA